MWKFGRCFFKTVVHQQHNLYKWNQIVVIRGCCLIRRCYSCCYCFLVSVTAVVVVVVVVVVVAVIEA